MYVIKDDTEYVMSENHPDLTNATAPRTTNATKKQKATAMKSKGPSKKKKKRLTVYQVVTIIQSKGIKSRLDLMALASKWQEQAKTDLAEFVSNRGSSGTRFCSIGTRFNQRMSFLGICCSKVTDCSPSNILSLIAYQTR